MQKVYVPFCVLPCPKLHFTLYPIDKFYKKQVRCKEQVRNFIVEDRGYDESYGIDRALSFGLEAV